MQFLVNASTFLYEIFRSYSRGLSALKIHVQFLCNILFVLAYIKLAKTLFFGWRPWFIAHLYSAHHLPGLRHNQPNSTRLQLN